MADFLILFGEHDWIEQNGLWKRYPASVIVSQHIHSHSLHVAFRNAPRPHPGDFGCTHDLAIAWIGNWRNLPQMRRKLGLPYKTSALETMAIAFNTMGEHAFSEMNGIITAVIWNMNTGTLHAFRDKIGLAPLVYAPNLHCTNHSTHSHKTTNLALSTDPDWLAEWLDYPNEINPARLRAFLSGSVDSGTEDFILGLERVRPGEHVLWSPKTPTPSRNYYWNPDTTPLTPDLANDALPQRLVSGLNHFYNSLNTQPRVVAMSGGLDSPSLAAVESRWGNYSQNKPLHVIAMVTPNIPRSDESQAIHEIRQHLPLKVHHFNVEDSWPLKNQEFYHHQRYSGPHFHPEEFYVDAYHRWIANQFGSVDVLSGHGTDDALWCPASFYLRDLAKNAHIQQLALAIRMAGVPLVAREMITWALDSSNLRKPLQYILVPLRNSVLQTNHTPWRNPENWVNLPDDCPTTNLTGWSLPDDNWGQVRLKRLRTWKWELVCRTLQREARRNSVNIEFPMLDDAIWELCLRIEPHQLAHNGRQKALLRKAMTGWLPDSAIQRTKHGGFDALVELALSKKEANRIENLFKNSLLENMEVINSKKFLTMFRQYQKASQRNALPYVGSLALWQTIAAEVWLNSLHQHA